MMISSLKQALNSRLKTLKVNHRLKEMKALAAWEEVAGSRIADQTRATRLINGRLYVSVSSSVWAHQLTFFRGDYIKNINEKLGESLVKDIFFQVGNIDRKEELQHREEHDQPEYRYVILSKEEEKEIQNTVSMITDERLQRALHSLMVQDKKAKKMKIEEGWKECPICRTYCPPSQEYCPYCQKGQAAGRRERLGRWFSETPWISFEATKEMIPDLQSTEFMKTKENIISECLEFIRKVSKDIKGESLFNKEDLVQKALFVTMMVTELTPDALDYEIIKSVIGEDLYEAVF